jgi:hypothetical protein
MGGALAFAASQHCAGLTAAAPLYGTPAREMPWVEVDKIKIPISYHTGNLDAILGMSYVGCAAHLSNIADGHTAAYR